VEEKWKRMDEVTSGKDKRARVEEDVLEVSMSASNQEERTVRTAVAFSKQPAIADLIKNTTP
jgi:hypothetical protein